MFTIESLSNSKRSNQSLPFRQAQGPELAEGQPTPSGLFPPFYMIKILSEIAIRALIRILPMFTRSGFPSISHRFTLAPFTSRG